MSDDQQLVFEFVADESGIKQAFTDVEKQAKKTGDKVDDTFSKKDVFGTDKAIDFKNILGEVGEEAAGLVGRFGKLGIAVGAVAVVGAGLKQAFDLAVEGEKINQINSSFEILGSRAGANVQKLRADLEAASGGLADMEDILKTATIASTEFGAGIEKLPDILKIARAASIQFGGDVEARFQQLVNAVASGNTRALREIGLFVDAGRAVDDFAKATGRAKTELNQVAERQAVLNAVLEKGQKVFAGVNIENGTIAQSSASVSAAFKEINDSFALIANAAFGQVFQDIASGVSATARAIAGLGPEAKTPINRIRDIDAELGKLQERLKTVTDQSTENSKKVAENIDFLNRQQQGQTGFFEDFANAFSETGVDPKFFQAKVDGIITQMKRLEDERKKLNDSLKPQDQEKLFNDSALKDQLAKTQKFQEQLRQINNETARLRLENIVASSTAEQAEDFKLEEAQRQSAQRKLAITQQFQQDLTTLDQQQKQFTLDRAKFSADQQAEIETRLTDRRLTLTKERSALIAAETARSEQEIQNIKRDSAQKYADEENKRNQKYLDLTKQFYTGLVNTVVAGVTRIGASLREGGSAFDGFLAQVLNILGDLAIQIGTTLLTIGLGIDALKTALTTITGGYAIVAGLALIALGGLLKSFGGISAGGNTSTSPGGGIATTTPGGGSTDGPGGGTSFVPPEDQERQAPKTEINLSVNGNILGTSDRSLALALTEILDDNFSSQGLVLKRS